MEHIDKLGAEDGVCGGESTPREDTQLEKLRDGPVLGHLCIRRTEHMTVT